VESPEFSYDILEERAAREFAQRGQNSITIGVR
jgi:hypothetical protein